MLAFVSHFVVTTGIALRALRRNTMRSILTAIGIIIGVAAVVVMVAIGKGAQASIEAQVSSLGSNLLLIFPGSKRSQGVNSSMGSSSTITLADAAAIEREIPSVVASSPEVTLSTQVIANGRNWSTSVVGESPDYLKIRDWAIDRGTMFTAREVRLAAKVAVIGSRTARELFGPIDPIGQTVRIKDMPFTIIGQLTSKGAGMGGQNQDDRLIIPYTTAMRRLTGERYLRTINLQIRTADQMEEAQQQITALLRQRHRLVEGRADDFNIFNQKEIADTLGTITRLLTWFLGAVSGLSLLVGGIGIMNIMLVSVTERTREIGIRIAVGAQPGDILLQFLIESITLSLLGGAIGVGIGVGGAQLASLIPDFKAVVTSSSIVLAFGVSFAIGVFFGFYPARKASMMDPIDALRFE